LASARQRGRADAPLHAELYEGERYGVVSRDEPGTAARQARRPLDARRNPRLHFERAEDRISDRRGFVSAFFGDRHGNRFGDHVGRNVSAATRGDFDSAEDFAVCGGGGLESRDRFVSYADFITLLFAFFVVLYSSSQVDKRKVGRLALAIQVAFQELGVFETSNTKIPISETEPMPFANVQAVENVERTGDFAHFVSPPKGVLGAGGDPVAMKGT
jgi:Membrane MotB of proton-channel complex MotA/MotB